MDNIKRINDWLNASSLAKLRADEAVTWYRGIDDELVKFYTQEKQKGVYAARYRELGNSRNYYWVVSANERDVKRTHSGLPNAMVTLLSNALGVPKATVNKRVVVGTDYRNATDYSATERLTEILDECNFVPHYQRHYIPYTLVVGDGAYFPVIEGGSHPAIEYYDGRNVRYEYSGTQIKTVTAWRYVRKTNEEISPSYGAGLYALYDTRSTTRVKGKTCATVSYHLYKMSGDAEDRVEREVPLNAIPEFADLRNVVIPNINTVLAVPVMWQYDPETKRGVSLFAGRIGLFDDLDQCLSQRSTTCRASTPVEYVSEDIVDYDKNGNAKALKRFDRRFQIVNNAKTTLQPGTEKLIETTQPMLNTDQYNMEALEITMECLAGLISPASLGLMLARNETALAQREKEKVTLITRDAMIRNEQSVLRKLFAMLLNLDDWMKNGDEAKNTRYDVTIDYPEYANPSFDSILMALQGPWASGMISPEQLVNEVWGDSLSDDERKREIEFLADQKNMYTSGGADPYA